MSTLDHQPCPQGPSNNAGVAPTATPSPSLPSATASRHPTPPGAVQRCPCKLLSSFKYGTKPVLDLWSSTFQDPTYQGSEFLELQRPDRKPIQPLYLNGGPWLSCFGHSITEFACVCWCITGHMPIGAYYRHFKINEPHGCTCGAALQSRQHILFHCRNRYSTHYPHFLGDIASFMKYNPTVFGFNWDPSGVG
ncbi:unnamed protein product [Cyclocybe aegerita]|uniref:Uncharacterized protein n=1 Tax=Cyclocybe aegerita TaxID=1973307 RepID=A0A8S0WB25_CYCAE|nr:unnamed protein product [Cyclocybe aegerita]